ncbi:MAG: O-antigen ligase family protein, partial [Roseovarius sp.]
VGFTTVFAARNAYDLLQITFLLIEVTAFSFIFRKPGAVATTAFINLIVIYAAFSLFWKLFIHGYGFWDREDMVFSGVIKFGMICAMGYALLLLTPRAQLRPGPFDIFKLGILFLGVVTTLSRTPMAFVVLVTAWYLMRNFSPTRWLLAGVGVAALAVPISQSRFFHSSGMGGSLIERILQQRAHAWQEAWDVFLSAPLFGPGGEAYRRMNSWDLRYPHNVFMDVLINTGVVGLMVFAVIFALRLRQMNGYHFAMLATSMTSGDIFLWLKVLIAGPRAVDATAARRKVRATPGTTAPALPDTAPPPAQPA